MSSVPVDQMEDLEFSKCGETVHYFKNSSMKSVIV